jgi:transcriptional regulator with XRE-family HTH domain
MANSIRTFRERAGLTEAQLAARSGLTVGYIRWLEESEAHPKVRLHPIAAALGVAVDELAPPPR